MNLLKISAFAIIFTGLLAACSENSPFKSLEDDLELDLELENNIYRTQEEIRDVIDSLEAITDSLEKEVKHNLY